MKAILVIDMPQDCLRCPCYRQAHYEYLEDCKVALRPLTTEERDKKPSWCPLKPMPQKKDFLEEYMKVDRSMCKQEFDRVQEELRQQILGYNYCIDEILGEQDEV